MDNFAPISLQRGFWNAWNATHSRDTRDVSVRQAEIVLGWFDDLGCDDLDILEVGCGSGWLCPRLLPFGRVTGTDLSDEVLAVAQRHSPTVSFLAGDFMNLDLQADHFDVLVTLEMLSHVADQEAFVAKLASHLKPGGYLMLATQNRFVLERFNHVQPPAPGQLRRWVDLTRITTTLVFRV